MKKRMIGWLAAGLFSIPISGNAAGIACPVSAPANGFIGTCPSVLASGSTCSFACNSGFNLVGPVTSCNNGVLTAQSCAANACAVSAPANGTLGTCSSVLSSGSSCSLACNAGFTLTGTATACLNGSLIKTQMCTATPPPADAATDGPIPLWALAALGAGLFVAARRRLKQAA